MLSNFKKQIHSIASIITILALFVQLVPVTVFSQDFTIPDIKLTISEIDGTVDQDEKVKAEIKLTNDTEINYDSPHDTIFVITDVTDPENPVEIDTIEDDPVTVDVGTSILRDIEFEIPTPGTREIRILYTEDSNSPTPQRSFFNDFDEETIIVQSGNELPDLQLQHDLVTQNPKVNEDIKIRFAIENTTEINYSSDNSFEVKLIDRSNNQVLDRVDRDSLSVNAGQTIKGDLSFQTSTTGKKDLRIELDENSTTPTPERSFFNNIIDFSINVEVDQNTELPDLVLTTPDNTITGTEDEAIQFKVNVRNTQETPYESDENTVYSIYESGTDNLIKTIVEDPLSLSQNESRTDILSITFSEPGTNEVDILVNNDNTSTPERSFLNNKVTITFTVEEDDNGNNNNNSTLPDLDIISIQAIPSIPKTGEEVTLRTRIQNRTEEDYFASNFKIQLIDVSSSTTDELRTYNLGNLSLNGFETETFNLTYTFNESKDFDLQLFIPNQGDERSFFNNVEEFSLFVAPTDTPEDTNPDLSIQATAIPSQIRENDSAVFRISITNVGDERYNTDVRPSYILRNTDTRITLETFIGDRLDLDPGESDTFEFTYRFTTPGSYPLEVELINTRGEINRSNNTDTTSVLVTSNNTPVNFPDLTINVTPSDTRIEQFDFVTFDVRISNIGTARYNVSSLPYFLILKDRDTGENLDFFTFNSLNIGPGSSETVEFRYRFTEEKTFDLEIKLAGTIGESNFANNDDFVRIFVEDEDDDDDNDSDGRDLSIDVDYSPRNPEVDERVEFEVEIENVGDEDYRSNTNPTLIFRDEDNNDVLERFRLNDLDLDPGDTETFEFTYRFDEDRRWDLEIELDGPLSETRTSNNIERFTIDVDDDDNDNDSDGRDLSIDVDYSPRNPEEDERVEFEVEIENVGDEDYRSSTNPTLIFRDDDNNDVLRRFTLDDLDLDPGDTETFEFTYRFDEERRWDLEIELDGPLSETRTSNNIERFTINVDDDNDNDDDDGPDLLLDVDYSPRFPDEDQRVEFEITVRNIGDEDYDARSDMEIELIDTDTNRVLDRLRIDEDDFRLRDGEREEYELDYRFDDEGTYFLRAQIFPEGSGPREASTSNNRQFFELEVDNDRDSDDDDDDDDSNGECDIIGKGTYYGIDDNESVQLGVAQSGSLEPCVRDADLDDYRWSVDDRDIATISDDGVLRARGDGRVTVTAEHRSEDIEAEQVILVGSAQVDDDFNDLRNELRRQKNRKYREILENLFQYLQEVPSNKRLKALRHKVQVMEAVENLYVHAYDEGIRGNILDETGYLLLKSLYIDEAKDDTIEAINNTATNIRSGNASSRVSDLKDKAEFNLAWANQLKFAERIMPYKDTVDNVWYTYYVYWDTNRGIIDGYYDKQNRPLYEYRPGNNISVAEVIKIALESADVTIRNGVPDNTRARNNWTQKYIYTAEQENLTLVENNVDIHRPATRAEIVRAVLEAHNINPSDADDIDFDDVSESHEDADFIQHALEEGIISGDEASKNFRPDDFLNRAEVAKIAKTARENL